MITKQQVTRIKDIYDKIDHYEYMISLITHDKTDFEIKITNGRNLKDASEFIKWEILKSLLIAEARDRMKFWKDELEKINT